MLNFPFEKRSREPVNFQEPTKNTAVAIAPEQLTLPRFLLEPTNHRLIRNTGFGLRSHATQIGTLLQTEHTHEHWELLVQTKVFQFPPFHLGRRWLTHGMTLCKQSRSMPQTSMEAMTTMEAIQMLTYATSPFRKTQTLFGNITDAFWMSSMIINPNLAERIIVLSPKSPMMMRQFLLRCHQGQLSTLNGTNLLNVIYKLRTPMIQRHRQLLSFPRRSF
jgi:hypothetical protein